MSWLRRIHLPLAACVIATAIAAGFATTGFGANVASIDVTVVKETHLNAGTCSSLSLGFVGRGQTVSADCSLTFGSINWPSVQLRVSDASDAWGMQAGAAQIADLPVAGGQLTSGFGMCVRSVGGGATAHMTTSPCAPSDMWYGLGASPSRPVASSAVLGDTTVGLRFGVATPMSTPPGAYVDTVTFEVLAL